MSELAWIAEGLRGLATPIEQVHEDPANARTGHAVERIAASLRQYGQRKPIVANRSQGGKVEAGNGTLLAALSLGWSHIAVVWVEEDAASAAGYGIADNRTGELRWEMGGDGTADGGHATQKPLEAMGRAIRNHSGDVYDPFLGSGTTLIAAENAGRRCWGVEIEAGYVGVILQRYADAFGLRGEVR